MPKIDKKRRIEIEKRVNQYIKTGEKKDENGVVTGNSILVVAPETLMNFFVSGVLSGLTKREAAHAKHYLKSKLPFKAYNESRSKDKEKRIEDILHFHDLLDGGMI